VPQLVFRFILVLCLLAFSGLVSTLQYFAGKRCLRISALRMRTVTWDQFSFLQKVANRFYRIAIVDTRYLKTDMCKCGLLESHESRALLANAYKSLRSGCTQSNTSSHDAGGAPTVIAT